jgi:ubiquinone/menaquinone biosynthesis C-methylase UbiE
VTTETAWELAYQRFETPEQERRKFIRRLRSLGVDRWDRSASVLEICSGRGNGLVAWRQLGFQNVTGVDLSPALIEVSELRRSCIVGDARALPIQTASRDVAIVQGGLHHLPQLEDVGTALAEMHRVLKPDGRVIIIEPSLTPFLRLVHFVSERPLARAMSNTLDAFAAMTDEERPTYERWLARGEPGFEALTAAFEPILLRRRWGKVVFLGRPR